jgi:hypothetical protein
MNTEYAVRRLDDGLRFIRGRGLLKKPSGEIPLVPRLRCVIPAFAGMTKRFFQQRHCQLFRKRPLLR